MDAATSDAGSDRLTGKHRDILTELELGGGQEGRGGGGGRRDVGVGQGKGWGWGECKGGNRIE